MKDHPPTVVWPWGDFFLCVLKSPAATLQASVVVGFTLNTHTQRDQPSLDRFIRSALDHQSSHASVPHVLLTQRNHAKAAAAAPPPAQPAGIHHSRSGIDMKLRAADATTFAQLIRVQVDLLSSARTRAAHAVALVAWNGLGAGQLKAACENKRLEALG
eukprot:364417-Chlamydomonas_euryale.AAC.7